MGREASNIITMSYRVHELEEDFTLLWGSLLFQGHYQNERPWRQKWGRTVILKSEKKKKIKRLRKYFYQKYKTGRNN